MTMEDFYIIISVIGVLLGCFLFVFGTFWLFNKCSDIYDDIREEDAYFNGGRCPYCANELKYFDTDLKGRRGYYCDNCEEYHTWVKYRRIDRNYINKLKRRQ